LTPELFAKEFTNEGCVQVPGIMRIFSSE